MRLKIKILLLFLFVFPMVTTMFAQVALAQETNPETETKQFTTDWVSVELTSWNNRDLGGAMTYDNVLKFAKGGYGIDESINHGRIAYDEATQQGVFLTELKGSFYALAYTDALVDNCITYTPIDKNQRYLNLITFSKYISLGLLEWGYSETTLRDYGFEDAEKNKYSVTWNSYDITAFDQRDYQGTMGIKIKIADSLPNGAKPGDKVNLCGVDYTLMNYTLIIKNVEVTDIETNTVGDYNTQYASDVGQQIQGGAGNSIASNADDPSAEDKSGAKENCIDDSMAEAKEREINNEITSLGVHQLYRVNGITENLYGSLSGQYATDAGCVGQIYDSSNDQLAADDEFQFSHLIRLKPEVTMDVNNFVVQKENLGVDNVQTTGTPAGIKKNWDQQTYDASDGCLQILGFHIVNYVVKVRYTFSVFVYSTFEMEGELTDGYLEDPSVKHGDTLYNNYMTEDKANVMVSDPWADFWASIGDWWENMMKGLFGDWFAGLGDWWSDYMWIVVLIAIAIILTAITIIVVKFKKRKGSSSNMPQMPDIKIITGGK